MECTPVFLLGKSYGQRSRWATIHGITKIQAQLKQLNTHTHTHKYMHVLSCFSRVRLFATLWTVAHQAPLSMGFSRQEYSSGLPFPPLGESPQHRDRMHISYLAGRYGICSFKHSTGIQYTFNKCLK